MLFGVFGQFLYGIISHMRSAVEVARISAKAVAVSIYGYSEI